MEIKRMWTFTLIAIALLTAIPTLSQASFVSGSTGADGALVVSQSTSMQVPESGVFNFTTVTINTGVTLTFKPNAQNTPVTILATGNVTINGTISLNGANSSFLIPGNGGPGGFKGGVGGVASQSGRRGEGPGGGLGGASHSGSNGGGSGGGGGFSSTGTSGSNYTSSAPGGAGGGSYGNERLLPMIGGSGGGGGGGTSAYVGGGGGGGGGSIVIASSGTITVGTYGTLSANGGTGANGEGSSYNGGGGGGGAGGSIRLIANTISGSGDITATGGLGGIYYPGYRNNGTGAKGRIRFEASSVTRTTGTDPPVSFGAPSAVMPENAPTLRVVSIGGINVPAIPRGDFDAPDIVLPYSITNPLAVVVQAENVPASAQVTITANPAVGASVTGSAPLQGTDASSTALINLNVPTAYPSVLTASVTYQLIASNFYLDGEKVDKVRVATTVGGNATVTYITVSGKEIPAYL